MELIEAYGVHCSYVIDITRGESRKRYQIHRKTAAVDLAWIQLWYSCRQNRYYILALDLLQPQMTLPQVISEKKSISWIISISVWEINSRFSKRVLLQSENNTKTGLAIIDVLKSKLSGSAEPGLYEMYDYTSCPYPLPLLVTQESIYTVITNVSGLAGLIDPHYEHLKYICMQHGRPSQLSMSG